MIPLLWLFSLTFSNSPTSKQTTQALPWTISAYDMRSELVDLAYSGPFNDTVTLLGDVAVQKSTIVTMGYQWAV